MDGYQSAKIIKSKFPHIPVIALTASVLKADHDRVKAGDFNGFLPKPIIKARLFEMLGRFIAHHEAEQQQIETQELQSLTADEQAHVADLLVYLTGPVSQAWELSMATQRISDINIFVDLLRQSDQYLNLKIITNYVQILSQHVDAFAVIEIQQVMQQFKSVINKVKALQHGGIVGE